MKKSIRDPDMPVGRLKIVKDFLPAPDKLVCREETVKVTIALNKKSVDFFKQAARHGGTKYQKMIRSLLDYYAGLHAKKYSPHRS